MADGGGGVGLPVVMGGGRNGLAGGEAGRPGQERGRGKGRARRRNVGFSAKVARAVCRRVETGEPLSSICLDEGMPSHGTVTKWAKEIPVVGRWLARAKALGGWSEAGQPPRGYSEEVTAPILARVCEGEALTDICADPAMPSTSSVYRWLVAHDEFARAMALARRVQAERFCDLGWAIAEAVTPETAYATRVKLEQLRWTAGAMAPKTFGRTRPVESEAAELAAAFEAARPLMRTIVHRHFMVEEREGDGAIRVAAFRPDPATGKLVREEPAQPWGPRPGGTWVTQGPWNGRPDGGRPRGTAAVPAEADGAEGEDGGWV